jgi:hypothetical protein
MDFKRIGFVLIVVSLVIISFNLNFSITGNVVSSYFSDVSFFNLLPLGLFLTGFVLLFTSNKKTLDYLVLPGGWEEQRSKRAEEEMDKEKPEKIVITGYVEPGKLKGSHRHKYYKELRNYGLKPKDIRILQGKDSEEDVLYLGEMVKEGDKVGFVTFPSHFKEYQEIIKKAREEGKFPKDVKVKNINTGYENFKQWLYGIGGWLEEKLNSGKVDYENNREESYLSNVYSSIKGSVKKLLRN